MSKGYERPSDRSLANEMSFCRPDVTVLQAPESEPSPGSARQKRRATRTHARVEPVLVHRRTPLPTGVLVDDGQTGRRTCCYLPCYSRYLSTLRARPVSVPSLLPQATTKCLPCRAVPREAASMLSSNTLGTTHGTNKDSCQGARIRGALESLHDEEACQERPRCALEERSCQAPDWLLRSAGRRKTATATRVWPANDRVPVRGIQPVRPGTFRTG